MAATTPVAIVGAGPYGLSLAAHLRAAGVEFRIFGPPLDTWRRHMPRGMLLKSDGFASNLFDPQRELTLARYCARQAIAYDDTRSPVSLEVFNDYAMDFQRTVAPDLETAEIVNLDRTDDGFVLTTADGVRTRAAAVVAAVGITHFAYTPPELAALDSQHLSHASDHHDMAPFKGRDVAVVGGGASAVEIAALLAESGARPRLVTRRPSLRFFSEPGATPPSAWRRLRRPSSGIGPGWRSRLLADAPWAFRFLPEGARRLVVRRHLGPASAWHLKDRVVGRMPILTDQTLHGASRCGGKARLELASSNADRQTMVADHVIAATGFRPDVRRLSFLSPALRDRLSTIDHAPRLSAHFESTVSGLYFVGPAAALTFGPLMRFMVGAGFAAPTVTRRLAGVFR